VSRSVVSPACALTEDERGFREFIGKQHDSPARLRLLRQCEHVVKESDNGPWPVVWVVPAGTKAAGHSDHWVAVEPGASIVCSCGEVVSDRPMYEFYLLETIVQHFSGSGDLPTSVRLGPGEPS